MESLLLDAKCSMLNINDCFLAAKCCETYEAVEHALDVSAGKRLAEGIRHGLNELREPHRSIDSEALPRQSAERNVRACGRKQAPEVFNTHRAARSQRKGWERGNDVTENRR